MRTSSLSGSVEEYDYLYIISSIVCLGLYAILIKYGPYLMGVTSIKIGRAKTGAASSGVGDLNAFKNLVRKVEIKARCHSILI